MNGLPQKQVVNPFRPGRIAGPDMFAGRVDEVFALERILLQAKGANAQHFLLAGERGIGKSSLLLFLRQVASGNITSLSGASLKFLVVEFELDGGCTADQLVKLMANALHRALAQHDKVRDGLRTVLEFAKKVQVGGMKYTAGPPPESYELMDDLVEAFVSTSSAIKGVFDGILVMIDEADKASVEAGLGAFCKTFTDRLTKRGCDNVTLGLAGVTGIVSKLAASHESAPRVFSVFTLMPLEPKESQQVVTRGMDRANKDAAGTLGIKQEAVQLIATLSEGFPHFVQQFAYSAFDANIDGVIDEVDVLKGALGENGALDQLGEKYFRQMYFDQIGSNEYRLVLQAMAQQSDADGWTTKDQIRGLSGLKETTLGNAIHTLKDRGIILAKAGEKGIYRLPTQSFGAWIRAKQVTHQSLGSGETK